MWVPVWERSGRRVSLVLSQHSLIDADFYARFGGRENILLIWVDTGV